MTSTKKTAADSGRTRTAAYTLTILAAGGIAYCNSFHGVFLLDDYGHIVTSQTIRSIGPFSKHLADHRPVVHFTLAVNYAVSELNPWSYHVLNLAIHLATAVTLFALVRRTLRLDSLRRSFDGRADALAFVVALLWVVHPLQTQAVTYIIQRGESLMGLFYLLMLYGLLRGATGERPLGWYVFSWVFCAVGMFTKEAMVTAPFAALLFDAVFLSRSWRTALRTRGRLYLLLAATWGILAYLGLFHDILYGSAKHGPDLGFQVRGLTPLTYALTQPEVILHYLRLCFWPYPQCFDFGWKAVGSWSEAAGPGLILLVLLLLTAWLLWKRPPLGFLGAWVFVILSPTSSVVPIKAFAFEQRMYLPLAAVILAVVLACDRLMRRLSTARPNKAVLYRRICMAATFLVTAALGARTLARNADYGSAPRMWADVVRQRPEHVRAWNYYGVALAYERRLEEAITAYEQALRLDPASEEGHFNLAKALSKAGRYAEAVAHYRDGMKTSPDDAPAHHSLAIALEKSGHLEEALAQYRRTLELDPGHPYARVNCGLALRAAGRWAEAATVLQEAVRFNPQDADAAYLLGSCLEKIGRQDDAAAAYEAALRINPNHAAARQNLSTIHGAPGSPSGR